MARSQGDEKREGGQGQSQGQGQGGAGPAVADAGSSMTPAQSGERQMSPGGSQAIDVNRAWSLRRVFDEFDRMFEDLQQQVLGGSPFPWNTGAGWLPRMQVQDNGRELLLTLELPGFEPDEINIECTEDVLTIRGEHREQDGRGGVYVERSFVRQVAVPPGCDVDRIQASYRNGRLTVRLPRIEESSRRIPISTDGEGGGAQSREERARSEQRAA
jgi:HSP20 family protein